MIQPDRTPAEQTPVNHISSSIQRITPPLTFWLALTLAGCDETDGTRPEPALEARGRFLDGAVEGLQYSAGSISGRTGPDGMFLYDKRSTAVFSIGGIEIGRAPATFIMTPIDLAGHGLDERDSTVTNIVRFLMTLDDDGDSFTNEISIPESVHEAAADESINFRRSISEFESDPDVGRIVAGLTSLTSAGVRELVPAIAAQVHLLLTIRKILSGTYQGTYHAGQNEDELGPALGTWTFVVFPFAAGIQLSGLIVDEDGTESEFAGLVASDGSFEAPAFGKMTMFGTIEIADVKDGYVVSGRWSEPGHGANGTFLGGRL